MRYIVSKTGLDVFDACRAYGLATLWNICVKQDITISDKGSFFVVECDGRIPQKIDFNSHDIKQLFTL
ncbi:MAG: hypothetical protein N2234_10600, partial [Planctomycetota bacterium]|nr:hypothetical protein [Planctomycetota bacterium]